VSGLWLVGLSVRLVIIILDEMRARIRVKISYEISGMLTSSDDVLEHDRDRGTINFSATGSISVVLVIIGSGKSYTIEL
jgi:hypothetical protein